MSLLGGRERRENTWPNDAIIPAPGAQSMGATFADVNLRSSEGALAKVAISAATNLIASTAAMLPVDGFSGTGSAKREITLPKFFENPDGTGHGLADWTYQALMSALLRGNIVGYVPEGQFMRLGHRLIPTQIILQHPDRVSARYTSDGVVEWRISGRIADPARIWHRRMYPMPSQILGLSPIQRHALTIGVGLSALRYGQQWFSDGAHPSGVLSNDADLTKEQSDTAKGRFMAAMRGRREPLVLGGSWKWASIQVSPEESQFLATQKYTDSECARIYGPGMPEMLGYETGSALTYQNRVERNQDLLTFTLDPWLTFVERALSELLPRPQYVKINRDALLRMTPFDRWQIFQLQLRNRVTTVNEVREMEDAPPVPWGDEPNELSTAPAPASKENLG